MDLSDSDSEHAVLERVRDAAAETLVTWASLPDSADARHRFDDHNSDCLVCGVGGRSLRVGQNRARQGELGVTGCCVWDAAVVLARYLEWAEELREAKTKSTDSFALEDAVHGRRCLELGAGCGLAGLAAASLGGLVTLTDREETLSLLERNVREFTGDHCGVRPTRKGKARQAESSCCSEAPEVQYLDWSEPLELEGKTYEVILAADCLYSLDGAESLARVVTSLCCQPGSAAYGARLLLSQELRAPEVLETFLEQVLPHFRAFRLPAPPTLERAAPCVVLYRLIPKTYPMQQR
ncbi:unnamed protein product [Effrenium voratum]|uniref:Uncharacterized protein n=1 Tax=Effrenium voratum TaxID=2562239 RepID=A0AA36JRK6_9DINO|nr:unnamed protein product [Effrenium voratum]